MRRSRRNLALILSVLLIIFQPLEILAATLKTIHVQFEYNGQATSYRLYQENALLCESFDTSTLAMDCEAFIGTDPITFTMTAVGPDGESPQSAPFTLVPPQIDAYGNYLPTASFTTSATSGQVPLQVTFDASASSDFDGSIIDYEWDFADGAIGTGSVVNHTFNLPGTYVVTLTVTDNGGATATANATIIVSDVTPTGGTTNKPPTAVINFVSTSPSAYQFNAYDSNDPDGLILSYVWNFGDGSTATGSYVEHEFAAAGAYTITLTVKDDQDATAQASTSVTVATTTKGQAPVAVITTGTTQNKVTASWEYNDITNISAFRLYQNNSFICGTTDPKTTELNCLTYLENGPMTFALKAVDINGNESLYSEKLTYSPATSTLPTLEGDAPFTLYFNGGTSSDADGTITSYHWNFGDGGTAATSAATHTFSTGGTYTVTLTVTDNSGNSSSATTTVTVHANTPPTAINTTINAIEDTQATGILKATDVDNDPLTYSIAVNGSKGKAVITNSATGAFTYTPAANVYGTDTFTFVVYDGKAYSNIATATVNIAHVNHPPVAKPVTLTTAEDTAVTGKITATDADNDPLKFTIGSNGTLGTAVITNSSTGAFTYTPKANKNGSDRFTINVSDGTATTSATVSVTITPVNDAPLAVNDTATTTSGVSVTINVLQNDSDPDGDPLTLTAVSAPAHGSAKISGQQIVYTPAANFSGQDSFTYTVSDSHGGTATASVAVTVNAGVVRTTQSLLTMQVTFAWDYNTKADIKGFNIYQNSIKICSTADPAARQLTCQVPLITTKSTFTMTSVGSDGTESQPSNLITYDPANTMPNYRLVTLAWDYNNDLTVQGFKMYMNNTPICETLDPQARTMSCLVPETTGAMSFSLTALDQNNNESNISNGIKYQPETPSISMNISDYDGDGDVDGLVTLKAAEQADTIV